MGLQINKVKTGSMTFLSCHTANVWSMEAYTWRVKVQGLSYRERLGQRVHYPECRVDLAAGFLAAHRQQQH